jgi:ParB/RepB/Spo0J family partition protein
MSSKIGDAQMQLKFTLEEVELDTLIFDNIRQQFDPGFIDTLSESLKKGQLHPIVVHMPDRLVLDGQQRVMAARQAGLKKLLAVLTTQQISRAQIKRLQIISAYHRAPVGGYDQAVAIRDIKADEPDTTNKELGETLDIDSSTVGKLLTLFACIQEVQDAARAGRLGVTDWYPISSLAPGEQAKVLAMKLNGASRDEVARESRKRRSGSGPAVRTAKIKCPLPNGQTVTVAGSELSLEDAIESLSEAVKLMKAALAKGLNAKTAERVWKDVAAAG